MVHSQILKYFFTQEKSNRKSNWVDKQPPNTRAIPAVLWNESLSRVSGSLRGCNHMLILEAGRVGLLKEQDRSCVGNYKHF